MKEEIVGTNILIKCMYNSVLSDQFYRFVYILDKGGAQLICLIMRVKMVTKSRETLPLWLSDKIMR